MKFIATYFNWAGERKEVEVTVHETKWPEVEGHCFYAEALATLGCGKNATTPEDAVYCLVSDHGNVQTIEAL